MGNAKKVVALPQHSMVSITPLMAQEWLEHSQFENRHVRQYNVDKIAADIRAGRWIYDGNPIRFDIEGNLIDGQHRLWAVIMAKKEVISSVVRGINHDAVDVIDTGNSRSTGDILHFNGYKNTVALAGVVRLNIGYMDCMGDMLKWSKANSRRKLSNQQIIDHIERHKGMAEATSLALSYKMCKKMMGQVVLSFSYFVLSQIDDLECDNFFVMFERGTNLQDGSPIIALRNAFTLRDFNHLGRSGDQTHIYKIALIFKAWKAYKQKKPVQRLTYSLDEAFPEVE